MMKSDALSLYPIQLVSRTASIKRNRRLAIMYGVTALALTAGSALSWNTSFKALSVATAIMANHTMHIAANYAPIPEPAPMIPPSARPRVPASSAWIIKAPLPAAKPLETIVASAPADPIMEPQGKKPPSALSVKVQGGDTLISVLAKAGVAQEEAHAVSESVRGIYNPNKLDIGQTISVQLSKNPSQVSRVVLPVSAIASVEVTRTGEDFAVKKVTMPLERKLARAGGRIESSLYETGIASGLPPALLSEIINAYSYDIDLQRDIKQGDEFDVLYERIQAKNGAVAGHGNVMFARLDLGDRELKIYRYTDASGNADYYSENGESIRKALLRTPINGARITSGFGARFHPLLGYTRMHRGVDFGAPIGTPIYAAGDGTVEFVGRKNGYGNYLRLKHNGTYSSAYAHISRFATGIAPGHKVKQGQIIAYVGMTGMATGPHLHYEILVNNEQVNPANVRFKTGNVLQGKELYAFRRSVQHIESQLASLPRSGNAVAMAETDNGPVAD